MNKFKKDDKVIVISGKDKGKVSKISKVFPKTRTVLLDNCHFATKHLKPNQQQQGGIKQLSKQTFNFQDKNRFTKERLEIIFMIMIKLSWLHLIEYQRLIMF